MQNFTGHRMHQESDVGLDVHIRPSVLKPGEHIGYVRIFSGEHIRHSVNYPSICALMSVGVHDYELPKRI